MADEVGTIAGRHRRRRSTIKTYDVTAREAAERLGVNAETVKRWARTGRVPAQKNMSGYWVFDEGDLDRLPVRSFREVVV